MRATDVIKGGCAVRLADVREIVELAHVDPAYYSLEGGRHEALCILAEGQTWKVFLSERGERRDERSFASEDEACTYFLKRLFRLWRPR
ncbi:MAG: hypothetical protein QOF28_759 [Actinomycetota bacterium]|jgi:hypothetical protein|nr:hypothetical protein [Actinomycetota bacterium]